MIIIFKLHGLAKKNTDLLPRVTYSYMYITHTYSYMYIYFYLFTYTYNFIYTHLNVYMMYVTPQLTTPIRNDKVTCFKIFISRLMTL